MSGKRKLKLVPDSAKTKYSWSYNLYCGKDVKTMSTNKLEEYYNSDKFNKDLESCEIESMESQTKRRMEDEWADIRTEVSLLGHEVSKKESYRCRLSFRILIIEDNLNLRDFYTDYIKTSCGFYNVDIAADGKQAIEMINNNQYDLILSDFKLPEANGYEIWKHISDTNYKTNFVLISGYSDRQFANLKKVGILCFPKDGDTLSNIKKIIIGYYCRKLDKEIKESA